MSTRAKRERRKERKRERNAALAKSRRFWYVKYAVIIIVVIGGLVGFIGYSLATAKILPPTSFTAAHSELLPPQQVNARPIDRLVQEHVMERNATHPDGQMLVQYNCEDYECEDGLEQSLEEIVTRFPRTVYLAPYPGMDAKIALAAPGRLETLDSLDEDRIVKFIRDNLSR